MNDFAGWLIILAGITALLVYQRNLNKESERMRDAATIARAEAQHSWVLKGWKSGTYGPYLTKEELDLQPTPLYAVGVDNAGHRMLG